MLNLETIEKEIEINRKVIEEFEGRLLLTSRKSLFTGTAFIVFERPIDVFNVLTVFDDSPLSRIIRFIIVKFKNCRRKVELDTTSYLFERAPEPTDVYWENLGVTFAKKFKNVLINYVITFLIIGFCFGVIYWINIIKDSVINDDSTLRTRAERVNILRGLSLLISGVIVVIN